MGKILVTGASGFIGNWVVKELLKKGHEVVASSADSEKVKKFPWYKQVHYIPFNLELFDKGTNYFSFFQRPDIMIHLAWEGLPNYKAAFHYEINLPRHFAFLSNILQHGLKHLTVAGTCLEYGMQQGLLSEDMTCKPIIGYAIAKDNLRKLLEELRNNLNFSLRWVRLFYMYGEGQNSTSLFPQLQLAIEKNAPIFNMSGGDQLRDYLPVEIVAESIVRIAVQNKVTGIINCCSGHPVSVKQLVKNYLEEHKSNIRLNLGYYKYTDYEPMQFWGDNSKLKSI